MGVSARMSFAPSPPYPVPTTHPTARRRPHPTPPPRWHPTTTPLLKPHDGSSPLLRLSGPHTSRARQSLPPLPLLPAAAARSNEALAGGAPGGSGRARAAGEARDPDRVRAERRCPSPTSAWCAHRTLDGMATSDIKHRPGRWSSHDYTSRRGFLRTNNQAGPAMSCS